MLDKGQTGRYSKADLEVLKRAFTDNEELLYEVRDILMGFKQELSNPLNGDVITVLKKFFLPEVSPDVPLGRQNDLYVGMDYLKNFPPVSVADHLQARELAIDYLKERFNCLVGCASKRKVSDFLNRDLGTDERYKNFLAYKFLVTGTEPGERHIESRVYEIEALCMVKEETEEEKKQKQAKNSNK